VDEQRLSDLVDIAKLDVDFLTIMQRCPAGDATDANRVLEIYASMQAIANRWGVTEDIDTKAGRKRLLKILNDPTAQWPAQDEEKSEDQWMFEADEARMEWLASLKDEEKA
jgi:hypothetical protein